MKEIVLFFNLFDNKTKLHCGLVFLSMLLGAFFEALGIGAIFPLLALMEKNDFIGHKTDVASFFSYIRIFDYVSLVLACLFLLILLYLIKNIYLAWQVNTQINFVLNLRVKFIKELFLIYLLRPYVYHLNINSAVLLRNLDMAGRQVFNEMLLSIFSLLSETITVIAILMMLIWTDPLMIIIIISGVGMIAYIIIKKFRKAIVAQANIQKKSNTLFIKWINQGFGSIKETKIMETERFFYREFSKAYKEYGESTARYYYLNQVPRMIIETIFISVFLSLIGLRVFLGESPEMIIPSMGVFGLAAVRLMPSANRIVGYYNSISFAKPFFLELYPDLLEIRTRITDKGYPIDKADRMDFQDEICVDGLHFCYDEEEGEVLKGISFEIRKGSFVGIIGPSGAGKTTFVDILLGLLKPTKGSITVDGQDIYADIRSWQANIAYVPQSIYLIDGTIADNIALGANEIDADLLKNVLKMANLYEFIDKMPQKEQTFVGERGVKLSGGQKQRIGIARALYQKPKVLVLDEATSALDYETEKSITDMILKFKGQITIIAIAHRISTLEACDFKVRFEDGRASIV